ncbi:MAG: nucleotidyltransferase domain-containing protein, partial [bacterium]|nr:nucleotidyltransferase domain-containing protein [bacterium]
DYPIKRITLFGSRAAGTEHEDSDVDLIMEFSLPISLLTLSMIKLKLEEVLKVGVDIVHGPIEESDLIEIGKVVELYAT